MLNYANTTTNNVRLENNRFMGRKPRTESKEFVPFTDFQRWLEPVLRAKGWEVADLARAMGRDYNYVYKIARADPASNERKNNIPGRPGYETAYEIGKAIGDIVGAIRAAGYPLPDQISGVTEGQTLSVFKPETNEHKTLFISPDLFQRLLLESELQEKGTKGN